MIRIYLALLAVTAAAETHTIYPEHHSRVFTAAKEPVLRIKSGDTVVTRTWDSSGQDYKGVLTCSTHMYTPRAGIL
jgi:hypothetical protein